jgi:hypothetical protein
MPLVFRHFAKGRPEWDDVVALLPAHVRQRRRPKGERPRHAQLGDRPICGKPTQLGPLRHEPVNEQGVVLLFGMLAKELGYLVEGVQKGFPDCEAKREIAPERWQRVAIEFEFESKNFRDHGHPATGCDVIVCWRHNWPECPKHIDVVELSRVIKSPATAEAKFWTAAPQLSQGSVGARFSASHS